MLRRNWPGPFRRTVTIGKKKTLYTFNPGEPVKLSAATIEAMKTDLGNALLPVELDEKKRPRIITDDVVTDDEESEEILTEEPQTGDDANGANAL